MAPSAIDVYPISEVSQFSDLRVKAQKLVSQQSSSSTNVIKVPLQLTGALDKFESFDLTPAIGKEFPKANLAQWLEAPNSAELLRDLAITGEFLTAPSCSLY